jgi:serine O-acetyltransferase
MFKLLRTDYLKYKSYGGHFVSILFLNQSFWALIQYRTANYFYTNLNIPVIREIVLFICLLWRKVVEITTGISIPASAKIGSSFYIGHFGGIILNAKVVIGSNCNISQGVTIGVSGKDENRGVPIIGNNVFIGANSVVVGKIVIEDNVLIGACSLVTSNALEGSVMLGVPARSISNNTSKGYL